jgi:CRP/FNR family transcriptional regulator
MVFEHGSSCNKCTIRKTTIFSSLSNTELSTISKMIQTINYRKKESVFLENSPMTDIYLVKNGIVKVYKSVQDGRQQILRLCGLGDIMGLDAVFSKQYYTTAKAVVDSTVCKIEKKDFLDFIYSKQELAVKLLQATSKELAFSQTQILNL